MSWGGGRKGGVTLLGQVLNSNRWARHSGKSGNTGVIEKVDFDENQRRVQIVFASGDIQRSPLEFVRLIHLCVCMG